MYQDLRPGRDYRVGWKEGLILLVVFFGMQSIIAIITNFTGKEIFNNSYFLIVITVITLLACIMAFDFLVVRKNGSGAALKFSCRSISVDGYLLVFPLMIGFMLVNEYIVSLIPTTGPFWGKLYQEYTAIFNQLSFNSFLLVVGTSIFAPILEEILFRGIIQKGLINNNIAPVKAILISSLIFGLIHGNPWQGVAGFLLGIILGYSYFKTKTLLVPMLLHAFNNFIASLLMIYTKHDSYSSFFGVADYRLFLVGIVLIVVFGYFFSKMKFKD